MGGLGGGAPSNKPVDEDGALESSPAISEHRTGAFTALSVIASEQHNLLRSIFRSNTYNTESSAQVQQQTETDFTDREHANEPLDEGLKSLNTNERQHIRNAVDFHAAVQAEITRVQKIAMSVDPDKDVVMRLDFLSGQESRAALLFIIASVIVGGAVLLVQIVKKMQMGYSLFHYNHTRIYAWNIGVSSFLLAALTAVFAAFISRVCIAIKHKKRWWGRRRRIVILHTLEAAAQWLNLIFYLAPNVYLWRDPCKLLSKFIFWAGFVRWSCWNTIFLAFLLHAYGSMLVRLVDTSNNNAKVSVYSLIQNPAAHTVKVMDESFWKLWPCLLLWVVFETLLGYAWMHNVTGEFPGEALCRRGEPTTACALDTGVKIGSYSAVALAAIYFITTWSLLYYKLRFFRAMPYTQVSKGIIYTTLQLWLRAHVMVFFVLSMALLWLVHGGSCASNEFVTLGIMPMQIVSTANAIVFCYLSMPMSPKENAAASRAWFQEVAWTEAEKPIKLAARAAMLPDNPSMAAQPLFCFQTMLNLLYWSCLVYDHNRGQVSAKGQIQKPSPAAPPTDDEPASPAASSARTILTLETAMGLYGLTQSESLWEVKQDTRCLVSWGASHVVVAFRGTASMKNALADLQAWRVAHPPARGNPWLGTRPLVHVGFLKSWLAGGLNLKVITTVLKAVQQCRISLGSTHRITVLVTGHSLGGALATLAAHNIRTSLDAHAVKDVDVACYTFAAPRTGNHAFAGDVSRIIPDCWSVINDQDVVTREGKMLCLYKRPGKRVIVDADGRLIIRPTHMEASVQKQAAGQSVRHHLLSSYFHAVLSVALAQFTSKGTADGIPGIIRLAEASPYIQDLLKSQMGMQLSEMRHYEQLDPESRGKLGLAGAHPPVKGFYLLKTLATSPPDRSSSSLMTRLRRSRGTASTHSLASLQEVSPGSGEPSVSAATKLPEGSLHQHSTMSEAAAADDGVQDSVGAAALQGVSGLDVVVDVKDA